MKRRMVVVSNRLPVIVSQNDQDEWQIQPGSGGLVTAMTPVIKSNRGVWVGWPGCDDSVPIRRPLEQFVEQEGYSLAAVSLTEEDIEKYYHGFSNETLWPLFHDMLGNCLFNRKHFEAYQTVNQKFAERTAQICLPDDFVWVHDYHLAMTGRYLRQLGLQQPLAFFLHIPFPGADLFRRLPWKDELLQSLLAYDLIGLQTARDHRNFVRCVMSFVPGVKIVSRHRNHTILSHNQRPFRVGHYPISIDFEGFSSRAKSKEVADEAWYLHEHFEQRQIILGIDRLDYTKGIPERFLAFGRALEKYPELHGKVSLLQVVVPSRTMVPDYIALKSQLEQLAGHINGRFSVHSWVPLRFHYRSLDPIQLLAHYRAAEIALVTPLRDGMNLVAKEYCASSVDNNGVLILSEFAGAIDQLGKHALRVNPYDVEATADIIFQAFCMPEAERCKRMINLRAQIKRFDVHQWTKSFVSNLR